MVSIRRRMAADFSGGGGGEKEGQTVVCLLMEDVLLLLSSYCHQSLLPEVQPQSNINPASSRRHVSHVEVDHVLGVGALDRDGEGFEGVKGEGNQTPDRVVDRSSQQSRLDFKLQEARVSGVEPDVWTEDVS